MAHLTPKPKPVPPTPVADAVKADQARRAREAAKARQAADARSAAAHKAAAHKPAKTSPAAARASRAPASTPARLHLGDLFPDESAAAVAAAVAAFWDVGGPLPIPRAPIACPVCAGVAYPREWQVYRLTPPNRASDYHRWPWRCDVSFKCHRCSAVWAHGLAISAEQAAQYGANPTTLAAAAFTWREAADRLARYLKG